MKLGVLASGGGTNLQAIIDAGLPVAVVVTDRPGVAALDRATAVGIPTVVVDRAEHLPDRVSFTTAIVEALTAHGVDLVAMAGFMTVLAEPIFTAFPGQVVNTHPSLLPSFRGAHAVPEALAAGVKLTGCTIHLATIEVDDGPILAQETVPVLAGDDEDALHDRIKAVEHRLYPRVLAELVAGAAGRAAVEGADDELRADGPVPVRRALVPVYDKTGLLDFARGLVDL
ncbi:MAG TPA: phosphoribosylglycinamide formyltransferase, partial [Acidimicrobiia bacterium]|nr:phosphoribosylglycinamide formyltransferase [Acidimicrobiia bacterium]